MNSVVCYLEQNGQYLMLNRNKKKDDLNGGKWIGVGGKVEPRESPEEALLREVKEETGLTLTHYTRRGLVTFCSGDITEYMFVYTADGFEGTLADCNEGELHWVDKAAVLSLPLWEGDRRFLPLLSESNPYFSLKLIYENGRLIHSRFY